MSVSVDGKTLKSVCVPTTMEVLLSHDDVAKVAERLLDSVETTFGGLPLRIVVEPLGEREVNVRIGWRNEPVPTALHRRRDKVKR